MVDGSDLRLGTRSSGIMVSSDGSKIVSGLRGEDSLDGMAYEFLAGERVRMWVYLRTFQFWCGKDVDGLFDMEEMVQ